MDASTRQLVRQRAGGRCEYCRLPENAVDVPFHIEHIIARQHGGSDDPSNLCLACDRCNLHKGPNLNSIDPDTGSSVPLFHPRQQQWGDHFAWLGAEIIGVSATGRTTARLLQMNARHRLLLRTQLPAGWDR
jgi:HNH endonuclease